VYRGPGVYRGPPEVYHGPCMKITPLNSPINYTNVFFHLWRIWSAYAYLCILTCAPINGRRRLHVDSIMASDGQTDRQATSHCVYTIMACGLPVRLSVARHYAVVMQSTPSGNFLLLKMLKKLQRSQPQRGEECN